jgi:hypothetical protein
MRIFLSLFLLLPAVLTAKPTSAKRTCRLLFLNPPPGAPAEVFLFDGTKSQKVELPSMNLSDVYAVPASATSLRLLAAPVDKAENIPADAPAAAIAETIADFYLIVTADPTNKTLPLRMQVIDAGGGKFGNGRMMWFNLTANRIGGLLGTQKLDVAPNSRAILEPPTNEAEDFAVQLFYALPGDPKPYPICRTKWVHDPRSRMLMFVYGGTNATAPQVVGFKDFRIAEKKE